MTGPAAASPLHRHDTVHRVEVLSPVRRMWHDRRRLMRPGTLAAIRGLPVPVLSGRPAAVPA